MKKNVEAVEQKIADLASEKEQQSKMKPHYIMERNLKSVVAMHEIPGDEDHKSGVLKRRGGLGEQKVPNKLLIWEILKSPIFHCVVDACTILGFYRLTQTKPVLQPKAMATPQLKSPRSKIFSLIGLVRTDMKKRFA